jgi:hypothetical protein
MDILAYWVDDVIDASDRLRGPGLVVTRRETGKTGEAKLDEP